MLLDLAQNVQNTTEQCQHSIYHLKEDSRPQKLFSRCHIIISVLYYHLLLYCHIINSVLLYSYYYIILILCINLDLSHIMYNDPWMK
jgi:hypothetical protein